MRKWHKLSSFQPGWSWPSGWWWPAGGNSAVDEMMALSNLLTATQHFTKYPWNGRKISPQQCHSFHQSIPGREKCPPKFVECCKSDSFCDCHSHPMGHRLFFYAFFSLVTFETLLELQNTMDNADGAFLVPILSNALVSCTCLFTFPTVFLFGQLHVYYIIPNRYCVLCALIALGNKVKQASSRFLGIG